MGYPFNEPVRTRDYPWSGAVPVPAFLDGDPVMSAVKLPPLPEDSPRVHRWAVLVEDVRQRHGGGLALRWVAFEKTYRVYASEYNIGGPLLAYHRLGEVADEAWYADDPSCE